MYLTTDFITNLNSNNPNNQVTNMNDVKDFCVKNYIDLKEQIKDLISDVGCQEKKFITVILKYFERSIEYRY